VSDAPSDLCAVAPGKLVLSGAYSVLWGAPCLVAAVSRHAYAFRDEPPTHLADEVRAAIAIGVLDRACRVDVSELRAPAPGGQTRKLGLGSSAAIVVATLAAARRERAIDGRFSDEDLQAIFRDALAAHRRAQGGGSGVDVAASTFGGVVACSITPEGLAVRPAPLPEGAHVEVVAATEPASTSGMVARVRAFEASRPEDHARIIGEARRGAEATERAGSVSALIDGLRAQDRALRELAAEARVPIFTDELDALAQAAAEEGAFFGPSGAGGGDVGFFVGERPPGRELESALARHGLERLSLRVGAPGVHLASRAGLVRRAHA
jgi:phosphomevalonate kinase